MYERYIKRTIDFTLAVLLSLLVLPFTIVIALIIKLTSKGPVLFVQERSGLHGKIFRMCKFRTMAYDNDVHDTTKGDRVTRVGRILRMTSLDELPQLINVIQGDMSFIGPRPWIPSYYRHMTKRQRRRNDVVPGITGLAQAYGRNSLTIHQKIAYDLEYVDNISLREDVKVVFVTLKTLTDKEAHELGKDGIHDELNTLRSQTEGGD